MNTGPAHEGWPRCLLHLRGRLPRRIGVDNARPWSDNRPMAPPSRHPRPIQRDDSRDGIRLIRRYHEATVQFHERRAEVGFVIDGATGELVFPAEPGFAASLDRIGPDDSEGPGLLLHLPDEAQRQLQLTVAVRIVERPEAEEAVDRWHAYHAASSGAGGTRPPARVWLRCAIEGGKAPHSPPPGEVYSGESMTRPNPLRKAEPRLVKMINADRPALGRICRARAGMEIADPLCVGVDPFGIDVRARFGIVRIEFDLEAGSAEQAEACIAAMREKCR